jgi:hypothetical protein
MSRPLVVTGLVLALALAACGGSDTSTVTSQPPNKTALHWSRCAGGFFQISTVRMSCRGADHFVNNEALGSATTGGAPAELAKSDPRNFTAGAFRCTGFPEGVNAAWHVLCTHGHVHVSFFITP